MASNESFTIKRGDTGPYLSVILRDRTGAIVVITGASVNFKMKLRQHRGNDNYPHKVSAAAVVTDGAAGQVEYRWIAADTSDIGDYVAEWEVTFADATERTFPTPEFTGVRVVQDI